MRWSVHPIPLRSIAMSKPSSILSHSTPLLEENTIYELHDPRLAKYNTALRILSEDLFHYCNKIERIIFTYREGPPPCILVECYEDTSNIMLFTDINLDKKSMIDINTEYAHIVKRYNQVLKGINI